MINRLNRKIFTFGSEQLKLLAVHEIFFAVVWAVGLLQAQAIPFCSFYEELLDSSSSKWLCNASKACMLIIGDETVARHTVVIVTCALGLLYAVTIALVPDKRAEFSPSYIASVFVKVSGLCTFIFVYDLIRPIQYFLMNLYVCNNVGKCLSVSHGIWLGVGILAQVLFVAAGVLLLIVFRESRPESHLLWAVFDGVLQPLQVFERIAAGALLSVGTSWNVLGQLSVVMAVLYGIMLVSRWKEGGEHRGWVHAVSLYQELLAFTTATGAFMIYLVGDYKLIMYISIVVSFPLFLTYNFFRQWDEERIIQTLLPSQQRSVNDIELYIERFIRYLRNPVDGQNYMKMTSVLNLHILQCENPECICNSLAKFVYKRRVSMGSSSISRVANSRLEGVFEKSYMEYRETWARFLILIVQGSLNSYSKVPALHLQLSYLYLKLLSNCYMSFYNVKSATMCGPSIFLRFQIYRQCSLIEEVIGQIIETRNSNGVGINIEKKIRFTDQFNNFLETAESCISDHQQFWETLLEAEPNMDKLTHYGERIERSFNKIREIYKDITILNPTNTSFFSKYAHFLKNVIHDDIEAAAIAAKIIDDNGVISQYKWNSWDKETGLLKISGDWKSLGQINDVNLDCETLLGYPRKSLIGMNCKKLMLPPIAKLHDKWVEHFYDTMANKVISHKYICLLSCKDGYYRQFETILTPSPHLRNGSMEFINLVRKNIVYDKISSNLSEDQRQPAVLICDKNFDIIGLNEHCKTYFSLPGEQTDTIKCECSLMDILPPGVAPKTLLSEGTKLELSHSRISQKLSGEDFVDQEEKDLFFSTDQAKYWGRIVERVAGDASETPVTIYLCMLIPFLDMTRTLAGSMSPRRLVKEQQDNASKVPVTDSVVSSADSENRAIRNFKLNLYERKCPLVISLLRYTMLVLALVIFSVEGTPPVSYSGLFCFDKDGGVEAAVKFRVPDAHNGAVLLRDQHGVFHAGGQRNCQVLRNKAVGECYRRPQATATTLCSCTKTR